MRDFGGPTIRAADGTVNGGVAEPGAHQYPAHIDHACATPLPHQPVYALPPLLKGEHDALAIGVIDKHSETVLKGDLREHARVGLQ